MSAEKNKEKQAWTDSTTCHALNKLSGEIYYKEGFEMIPIKEDIESLVDYLKCSIDGINNMKMGDVLFLKRDGFGLENKIKISNLSSFSVPKGSTIITKKIEGVLHVVVEFPKKSRAEILPLKKAKEIPASRPKKPLGSGFPNQAMRLRAPALKKLHKMREIVIPTDVDISIVIRKLAAQLQAEAEEEYDESIKYKVQAGDSLYTILKREFGIAKHPDSFTKKIRTVSSTKTRDQYTTGNFSDLEIGDTIYIEDGALIIERSPLLKFEHIVSLSSNTLQSITNTVFGTYFTTKQFESVPKILLVETINGESKEEPFDELKRWDEVNLKYVNERWQYIIVRSFQIPDIQEEVPVFKNRVKKIIREKSRKKKIIPILGDQKKKLSPEKQEKPLLKPITPVEPIGKKDPIEMTYDYAAGLIQALPKVTRGNFLKELQKKLDGLDRSKYKDQKLLDIACTEIRIGLGREFFPKLKAEEFAYFYQKMGGNTKFFRQQLAKILGKEPGIVEALGDNDISIKQAIEKKYGKWIKVYANKYELDYAFLSAIIQQESKGDGLAISPTGALGMGQHLKGVWKKHPKYEGGTLQFETSINPLNEEQSIKRTALYLSRLFKYFMPHFKKGGVKDVAMQYSIVASSYNAGQNRIRPLVRKYGNNYLAHLGKKDKKDPIDPYYARGVMGLMKLRPQELLVKK